MTLPDVRWPRRLIWNESIDDDQQLGIICSACFAFGDTQPQLAQQTKNVPAHDGEQPIQHIESSPFGHKDIRLARKSGRNTIKYYVEGQDQPCTTIVLPGYARGGPKSPRWASYSWKRTAQSQVAAGNHLRPPARGTGDLGYPGPKRADEASANPASRRVRSGNF